MPKSEIVTLPEMIKKLGTATVREACDCDESLPRKWAKGARPSWRNVDALLELAAKHNLTLIIRGAAK